MNFYISALEAGKKRSLRVGHDGEGYTLVSKVIYGLMFANREDAQAVADMLGRNVEGIVFTVRAVWPNQEKG